MPNKLPPFVNGKKATKHINALVVQIKKPQTNNIAKLLTAFPENAEIAARFYSYLNSATTTHYDISPLVEAMSSYWPKNFERTGYLEIDNCADYFANVHNYTATERTLHNTLTVFPTIIAHGNEIVLNRENLSNILRYEKDESIRKLAFYTALEAHPENDALFAKMLEERQKLPKYKRRTIVDDPTEFLETFAKELNCVGKDAWNWAYLGQKNTKNTMLCIDECLARIKDIFGISFAKRQEHTWHESVLVYSIGKTDKNVYLDLMARPEKRRGTPFTLSLQDNIIVCCHFGDTIDDVEASTLFHEMGHVLQFAMSRIHSLHAYEAIEEDFGEIPGVLMEYLAFPDLNNDISVGRQVALGLFDQYIHAGSSPDDAAKKAFAHWLPNGYGHYWRSFDHYIEGYGGVYYSYALAHWYAKRLPIKDNPLGWLKVLANVGKYPAKQLLDEYINYT